VRPSETRSYNERMCKLLGLCAPARRDGSWTGPSPAAHAAAAVHSHGPSKAISDGKRACVFVLALVRLQSPKSGPGFL